MSKLESELQQGLILLLASALLAACGVEPGTSAQVQAQGREDIVGGSSYSGLPAVGAITYRGSQHCTGTLIGARKVLTAAHCLEGVNVNQLRFVIGPNAYQPQYSLRVASVTPHPAYNSYALTNDIGYLTLSSDAPVAPMKVLGNMSNSFVGEPLFFVGYGVTNGATQSGAGLKRAVWMDVSRVDSTTFRYNDPGKNTCSGDSGGPAFYQTAAGDLAVAGVTSYGDWYCTQYGVDTRVDTYVSFLGVTPAGSGGGGSSGGTAGGCGQETYEGRCSGDTVVWCESGTVYQNNCGSDGLTCGWSSANNYYACVAAAPVDPCQGETFKGRCDGKTVIWCENQEVKSLNCNRCGYDQLNGYYNCL